jgi:hypothetical protein
MFRRSLNAGDDEEPTHQLLEDHEHDRTNTGSFEVDASAMGMDPSKEVRHV